MAKRNRLEVHMPVELIQEIQSYLPRREASVSACVAKSWNDAWMIRSDPVFDARDFHHIGELRPRLFRKYVDKIIKGHEEDGRKITSCRLYVNNIDTAKEIILKAMDLGAVSIEFETRTSHEKMFPAEVLESENLVELSVTGCKFNVRTNLSNLKSLRLCKVSIEDDQIIWDILSCRPLFEKLVFSSCNFSLPFWSPLPATSLSEYLKFHYLKYLILKDMEVCRAFFNDFGKRFPCLKGLDVRQCTEFTDQLEIHSETLESIHFTRMVTLRAEFHVPNIRKFSFVGTKLPCLKFEGASGEWESDLSITLKSFRTSWFIKLNKFLLYLSKQQSRITNLSLVLGSMFVKSESFQFPNYVDSHKPVVESLKIRADSSMSCGVMDALFWSFRPKSISLTVKENNWFHTLLFSTLVKGTNAVGFKPNRSGSAPGLEGIDIEVFSDAIGEFKPLAPELRILLVRPHTQYRLKLHWGMQ